MILTFKESDWKNVITFEKFISIAIKNKEEDKLPSHYEIIDKNCLGIIDDKNYFRPLKFNGKIEKAILKNKLFK